MALLVKYGDQPAALAAAVLKDLATADAGKYVLAATGAQLAAWAILGMAVVPALGFGIQKELEMHAGPFRRTSDPLMMSSMLALPVVNAVGLFVLKQVTLGPGHLSVAAGLSLAFVHWLFSAGFGLWMDYSTFRISKRVLGNFWASSLTQALLCGGLMGYLL